MRGLFRVHRLSAALSARLPLRRVRPLVFRRARPISYAGRNAHDDKMAGSEDSSKSFVLEEYNNVPVTTTDLPKDTVKDLTKDELKEWSPFKVHTNVPR